MFKGNQTNASFSNESNLTSYLPIKLILKFLPEAYAHCLFLYSTSTLTCSQRRKQSNLYSTKYYSAFFFFLKNDLP